jgi:hypothetical protein
MSDTVTREEFNTSMRRIEDAVRDMRQALAQITNHNTISLDSTNHNTAAHRIANSNAAMHSAANGNAHVHNSANENAASAYTGAVNVNECANVTVANQNGVSANINARNVSESASDATANQNASVCKHANVRGCECMQRHSVYETSRIDSAARVSIRAPELFEAGRNVRAWLQRLDHYFTAANIEDDVTQANTLASALSSDVRASLFKLHLSKETWNDPSSLKAVLIQQYDDRKTGQTYTSAFNSAQQGEQEGILAFFDRVYHLAVQAYPKLTEREDIEDVVSSLVQGQFIEGLRSDTIRYELLFHPIEEVQALKDRAYTLEQSEKAATLQGVTGPSTVESTETPNASFEFRPCAELNGRASLKPVGPKPPNAQYYHAANRNEASSTNVNAKNVKCVNVIGRSQSRTTGMCAYSQPESRTQCANAYSQSQSGTQCTNVYGQPERRMRCRRTPLVCYKCGKRGHIARECYSLRDVNGMWIKARRQSMNGPHHNMNGEQCDESAKGSMPASARVNGRVNLNGQEDHLEQDPPGVVLRNEPEWAQHDNNTT